MSEVNFPEPNENIGSNFDVDEIEVVEVDDTPEADRRPVRDDVEPFNIDEEIDIADDRVKKRLNRLKYEYHQQRREKEAAQRLRDEAVQFAQNSQGEVQRLQGLVGQRTDCWSCSWADGRSATQETCLPTARLDR